MDARGSNFKVIFGYIGVQDQSGLHVTLFKRKKKREREGEKGRDLAVKTNCSFIALVIETCS